MDAQTATALNAHELTCSLDDLERRIALDRPVPGYYCTVHHDNIESKAD